MLDPQVQKKGGFGAFAAREQERHDVREATQTQSMVDAPTAAMPVATPPAMSESAAAADAARADKTTDRPNGR